MIKISAATTGAVDVFAGYDFQDEFTTDETLNFAVGVDADVNMGVSAEIASEDGAIDVFATNDVNLNLVDADDDVFGPRGDVRVIANAENTAGGAPDNGDGDIFDRKGDGTLRQSGGSQYHSQQPFPFRGGCRGDGDGLCGGDGGGDRD